MNAKVKQKAENYQFQEFSSYLPISISALNNLLINWQIGLLLKKRPIYTRDKYSKTMWQGKPGPEDFF